MDIEKVVTIVFQDNVRCIWNTFPKHQNVRLIVPISPLAPRKSHRSTSHTVKRRFSPRKSVMGSTHHHHRRSTGTIYLSTKDFPHDRGSNDFSIVFRVRAASVSKIYFRIREYRTWNSKSQYIYLTCDPHAGRGRGQTDYRKGQERGTPLWVLESRGIPYRGFFT